jgi:subtilisin family serine protease
MKARPLQNPTPRPSLTAILALALAASSCRDHATSQSAAPPSGSAATDQASDLQRASGKLVAAIQPPPTSSGAAGTPPVAAPRRAIVRLRAALDQGLTRASGPSARSVDMAAASAAAPAVAALLGRHGARAAAPLYAARLREKLQKGLTDAQIAASVRQRFAARAARAPQNAPSPDLGGLYVLDLGQRTRAELDQELASLSADPDVLFVQEDRAVKATLTPDDPSFPMLWGMQEIQAPTAWDTTNGAGVVVAVVDSGVDYTHQDLDANIWTNPGEIPGDGLDNDGNGLVDDVRGWDFVGTSYTSPAPDNDPMDAVGHGTHVAGIIAAEGNNMLGVIGVAYGARVMVLRGLDNGGTGLESTLAPAIMYATDKGADVINASWGGLGVSTVLQNAIDYAHSHGVVFVAAAGNDNVDASLFYPANAPRAITVSACNQNGSTTTFSNFGNRVDVAAPGVGILSLAPSNGFATFDGTSMAAPHVSGTVALIISQHPTFTVEQIRQALRTSTIGEADHRFFGWGRVEAARAIAVTAPLEARFFAPSDGLEVHGPVALSGVAQGTGFHHYIVDYGEGTVPISWTTIVANGTSPVSGGSLGTFDPSLLRDNTYTIRLRVFTAGGAVYSDQVQISVRFALITSPAANELPVFTDVAKANVSLPIRGRATGGAFQSYRIEWAPGRDAGSGFSSAGVTLTSGGTTQIQDGVLAQWQPLAGASGEYSVRLTVTNTGFTSSYQSTVYLEPDLLSTSWPQFVGPANVRTSALPVRTASGGTRLVLCGYPNTAGIPCRSFAPDGSSSTTIDIDRGTYPGPAAGQLDSLPGEEVVIADHRKIRILTPTLATVREIVTPRQETFTSNRLSLADLDGDGVMEIIAIARATDASGLFMSFTGFLQVYRADGTLSSANYPLTVASPRMPNGVEAVDSLVMDLDGDGQKEILISFCDRGATVYDIQAFNADGTPFAAWPTVTFPIAGGLDQPRAADLDHDGHPEILIGEFAGGDWRLRVINSNGLTRAGWPVAGGILSGNMAIGDLDHDGIEEIVAAPLPGIRVLRPDGTDWGPVAWPPIFQPQNPVLADIDGDSFPEILVSKSTSTFVAGRQTTDSRIKAVSRTGVLLKEWRLFGIEGRQPATANLTIGDFTGDGNTDLAVHLPLVEGGTPNGFLVNGELSVLTTGTPFNPANAPWPMAVGDPQQSRVKQRPQPSATVHVAAAADAYVRDGSNAGTNFGAATTMAVKNTSAAGNNRTSYVRFPLASVSGTVTSARLRLFGNRPTAHTATDAAFAVSDNTWSETGINFNNKPALGARQGAGVMVTATAQYYEFDVTSFVAAQKGAGATAVSLAIQMETQTNDGPDVFNTKEAASNPPDLVVTSSAASPDLPPTVATPAAASPSPATGTTTALSVLGADDHGESNLTYTWSTTSAPAVVSFSANGTNAARNTTATFIMPGTYAFQAQIRDQAAHSVLSTVSVVVQATLTTIGVAPATASVGAGATQQFTATGRDQFGGALASQPSFAWTASGGGMISTGGLFTAGATAGGPFTMTAAGGGKSGTAQVTVTGGGGTPVTLSPVADAYVRDGTANAGTNFGTATTLVVKNSTTAGNNRISYLRFPIGSITGTVSSAKLRLFGSRQAATALTDGAYAVSSTTWSESGITFNNRPALGAKQGASVTVGTTAQYYEWEVGPYIQAQKTAGASAVTLAVQMDTATGDAPDTFNAREATSNKPQLVVTAGGGGANNPPTVATAAAASPSPATGTTTALSVLGADDQGEAGLVYTWSTTGTPPAAVTFSANGTNAAKNTTATFTRAGSYSFQVVVRDAGALTATSSVDVVVNQTLTSIVLAPATATVAPGGTQQFIATARDQFAVALGLQPTMTWSVSGGGNVNGVGLFTAGSTAGGPFTVTASSGGKSGNAQVTVSAGGTTTTLTPVADAFVRAGMADTNFGADATLQVKTSTATQNNRVSYLRFSISGLGATVTSAKLRLFGSRAIAAAGTDATFAVSNITWSETGITFNNRPPLGAKQGASVTIGAAQYYEWDVTAYVQAQKTAGATAVSLAVQMETNTNDSPDSFNSREAASNRPQLVVTGP